MKQTLIRATELQSSSIVNHMIQNLAYCALVEEQLRECVPYGLVIYAGQQVRRVEFTDSNRRWLLHTIAALQAASLAKQAKRNHQPTGPLLRMWRARQVRSGSALKILIGF